MAKEVEAAAQNCRYNAERLRKMAETETDNNVKKLLLEAAHHLDVGVSELEYVLTNATVSI